MVEYEPSLEELEAEFAKLREKFVIDRSSKRVIFDFLRVVNEAMDRAPAAQKRTDQLVRDLNIEE